MKLYQEKVQEAFLSKGYYLDELKRVRPAEGTPTVNFKTLFEVLRSQDEQLVTDN